MEWLYVLFVNLFLVPCFSKFPNLQVNGGGAHPEGGQGLELPNSDITNEFLVQKYRIPLSFIRLSLFVAL